MTRRQALVAVGLIAGNATRSFAGPVPPGVLTIDLSQYKAIRVKHGADEYFLDGREVFDGFKESFVGSDIYDEDGARMGHD